MTEMPPKAPKRGKIDLHGAKKDDDEHSTSRIFEVLRMVMIPFGLLLLAAVSSPTSQMVLSPVYGSIPASIYHQQLVITTFLLAAATQTSFRDNLLALIPTAASLIPIVALVLPFIQNVLFKKSKGWGPAVGPLMTESCTYVPILYLSVLCSVAGLGVLRKPNYGHWTHAGVASVVSYTIFTIIQKAARSLIERNIGRGIIITRCGLQYVIAILYSLMLPSKMCFMAWLLLIYPLSQNQHLPLRYTTNIQNKTLHVQGFSLLARKESVTGYISVLENLDQGFRAMRCDHSLLGGEWVDRQGISRSQLGEPIYSCFVMLEAVRLVECESAHSQLLKSDFEKQALVIGLGIGTSPSALITHGIQTTIVEIDPVVHEYAAQYFHLPENHTPIIKDAVSYVDTLKSNGQDDGKYDYIVHDVFTGGAEPIELFTKEFLEGLSYLLNSNGVIAINYGGDLLLESASLVVHTVLHVFPTCRLFREEPAPVGQSLEKDFTNMVMFCRKSEASFTFRKPEEADFLGSQARREVLLPEHEIEASYFDRTGPGLKSNILRQGHTAWLAGLQQRSVLNHWHIMRTVLPDSVWENW